jgi:hypothetical protein
VETHCAPACRKERASMPIRQYLSGEQFDAETTRIMGIAFEVARIARAGDRGAPADELIAKSIIELAQAGERDADRLCEYALAKVRDADGRTSQLFQSSSDCGGATLKPGSLT